MSAAVAALARQSEARGATAPVASAAASNNPSVFRMLNNAAVRRAAVARRLHNAARSHASQGASTAAYEGKSCRPRAMYINSDERFMKENSEHGDHGQ